MKVEHYKNDFYKLTGLSAAAVSYIKTEIPADYRFYEEGAWYVHRKYLTDLDLLGSDALRTTASSSAADYRTLHLLPSAPMIIVDAVFRALARTAHPDAGGDEADFKRLNAAYQRIKAGGK